MEKALIGRISTFSVTAFALFSSPGFLAGQDGASLQLSYVANHGVFLSTGPTTVLLDALYDRPNPLYFAPTEAAIEALTSGAEPFAPVDVVLVTHNHADHFSPGVVDRFLAANPRTWLVAPGDAVEALRGEGMGWEQYRDRVIALRLKVGEGTEETVGDVRVKAVRTLHSGDRDSPENLMYLVEMDGWVVVHEGDSNHLAETFRTLVEGEPPVDLAVVHDWFPFHRDGQGILAEVLQPRFIALGHHSVDPSRRLPGDPEAFGEEYILMDEPGERVDLPPRSGR